MDMGIWATWYDLGEENRARHLDWLHQCHLPRILRLEGIAWSAHYEILGGGPRMNEIHDRLSRPGDPDIGSGTQLLLLFGAASPHTFFHPRIDQWENKIDKETDQMLGQRIGSRACFFTQEAWVSGPEIGTRRPFSTPAPAIQMGSFRTKTVADEYDLAAWYAQYRLPAMSRMPGCVATRKLVSIAGWAKHSILYEFTSLQARQDHFQNHESLALDDKEWTNKIITYTVHSPGSPSVGQRIWPPVEEAVSLAAQPPSQT
jgi:hypothetical protein